MNISRGGTPPCPWVLFLLNLRTLFFSGDCGPAAVALLVGPSLGLFVFTTTYAHRVANVAHTAVSPMASANSFPPPADCADFDTGDDAGAARLDGLDAGTLKSAGFGFFRTPGTGSTPPHASPPAT